MKILNLTPHEINIVGKDPIPSSGAVRVSEKTEVIGEINGIPVIKKSFGKVEGLPNEQADTKIIVSLLVAQAAKGRSDLLVVGETIRNEKGQVIGAKSLAVV